MSVPPNPNPHPHVESDLTDRSDAAGLSAPSAHAAPHNSSGSSIGSTIGSILRMMFQSGATDEVVSRFVALYANSVSPNPLAPVIEMGPALQQAAQSAGVEVARELLGHIRQVRDESALGALEVKTLAGHSKAGRPGPIASVAAAPKQAKAGATGVTGNTGHIYRFDVAAGRTSVNLPGELLAAARKAFGEPELTKVIQRLYGQALSTRLPRGAQDTRAAHQDQGGLGPVRKVNKSSLVRQALIKELAAHQGVSGPALQNAAESLSGSGSIH